MTTGLQTRDSTPATAIEQALIGGDLSRLTTDERLAYYKKVCESLGLNYLTKPFDYINLNGKLTLYAKRDATDQLRSIKGVSVEIVERQQSGDLCVVRARATMPDGRSDESLGAVSLSNLKGEALANAYMKCETKAKRRVTLSICGLGWLDETETDSIADARHERPAIQAPRRQHQAHDPRDPDDPIPGQAVNRVTGEITLPEQQAIDSGHADTVLISDAQRKRFWAIAKGVGWSDEEIKHWLFVNYNIASTKDIRRNQYDEMCSAIGNGTEATS